jgi:CheY-like chemotaxis protein
MGGAIGVQSKEGEGSNFYFTIHSKVSKEPIQSYRLLNEISFDNKRVLVIDDNQTNLKILNQQLSSWGLEVVLVERAAQALTLLADETVVFDAVITDRQMPGMDGITLAKNIREQRKNMPIILLTSVTDDSHKNHKDLFAAVLTKPVKQHLLSKTLLMILKKTEKAQEGANVTHQRKLFRILLNSIH